MKVIMGLAKKWKSWIGYPEDDFYEDVPSEPAAESACKTTASADPFQTVLMRPTTYQESLKAADHLGANRAVVLNLTDMPAEDTRRLLDFLAGAAYAKNAKLERIARTTYLLLPYYADFQCSFTQDPEFFF